MVRNINGEWFNTLKLVGYMVLIRKKQKLEKVIKEADNGLKKNHNLIVAFHLRSSFT